MACDVDYKNQPFHWLSSVEGLFTPFTWFAYVILRLSIVHGLRWHGNAQLRSWSAHGELCGLALVRSIAMGLCEGKARTQRGSIW